MKKKKRKNAATKHTHELYMFCDRIYKQTRNMYVQNIYCIH